MLNCVAPGCGHEATAVLMGMSLCSDHREHWCQIQVSYYLTLPEGQLFPYFEFMAKAARKYAEAQAVGSALPETQRLPFLRSSPE